VSPGGTATVKIGGDLKANLAQGGSPKTQDKLHVTDEVSQNMTNSHTRFNGNELVEGFPSGEVEQGSVAVVGTSLKGL
jgi:hypothetical protein